MRRSWRESLRLRSARLFCKTRSPEICWVVYQEYATTAARVMTSPRNRPALGDRSQELCTPRAYTAGSDRSKRCQTRPVSECARDSEPRQNPAELTNELAGITGRIGDPARLGRMLRAGAPHPAAAHRSPGWVTSRWACGTPGGGIPDACRV